MKGFDTKMNKKRNNGFVFMLVIVVLALIGVQMFALSNIANTVQFQSHTQYLKACERNLLASGLAWAEQNVRSVNAETPNGKTIELDTGRMNIRGSALDVVISTQPNGKAQVRIKSSCTRGRQTLTGTADWTQP